MPGGDGTGPDGKGPRSGRGKGRCRKPRSDGSVNGDPVADPIDGDDPDEDDPGAGRRFGRGRGRGQGRGKGQGGGRGTGGGGGR